MITMETAFGSFDSKSVELMPCTKVASTYAVDCIYSSDLNADPDVDKATEHGLLVYFCTNNIILRILSNFTISVTAM